MGHGQLAKLLTLAIAVVAPAAAAAGRQLQEGTAGTCVSITKVSGRPFQAGQDAESLQVGASDVCERGYIAMGVRNHWSERTTMMVLSSRPSGILTAVRTPQTTGCANKKNEGSQPKKRSTG